MILVSQLVFSLLLEPTFYLFEFYRVAWLQFGKHVFDTSVVVFSVLFLCLHTGWIPSPSVFQLFEELVYSSGVHDSSEFNL